jgi:hypothetical protein
VRVLGLPPQAGAPPEQPTPLPAEQPAAPTPTPSPTPIAAGQNTVPSRAIDLTGPVEGALSGGPAGSFHYYRFEYPGDGSPVRLDLDVSPPDAGAGATAGLLVYGPTAGREYLRVGYQTGNWPQSGTFQSDEPGTYVAQVGNYGPRPIAYRLAPAPAE